MIFTYDPKMNHAAKAIFGDMIKYCDDCYDVLLRADALVLITERNEFRSPDCNLIEEKMNTSVIFDAGIYSIQKS